MSNSRVTMLPRVLAQNESSAITVQSGGSTSWCFTKIQSLNLYRYFLTNTMGDKVIYAIIPMWLLNNMTNGFADQIVSHGC